MYRLLKRKNLTDALMICAVLFLLVSLCTHTAECVSAASESLSACLSVIIPSLFPFFVISNVAVNSRLSDLSGRVLEPVMLPLFRCGGACSSAVVLGFLGGYPIGAKTVISLYESGRCSKGEAERLLAFCNNSGPAFILGVVGISIFKSSKAGLIIYGAHALSSLIVGLIFRSWGGEPMRAGRTETAHEPFYRVFTSSVRAAWDSSLSICGFVIFFAVLIKMLRATGVISLMTFALYKLVSPLGLSEEWAEHVVYGLFELTSGVSGLENGVGSGENVVAAAFMLGWAGLSVHCQVLSFIGGSGLSFKTYLWGKLLHGIISASVSVIFVRIFDLSSPVSFYLAERMPDTSSFGAASSFAASCLGVLTFLLLFLPLYAVGNRRILQKKTDKKIIVAKTKKVSYN